MKTPLHLAVLLAITMSANLSAQPSAFTYQGQLTDSGSPANGSFDFTFSLWEADTGSAQVGSTLTNPAVPVSNGVFTLTLDFGGEVFDGNERWLEIGVRTNGTGTFAILTPRQRIAATPYAHRSAAAGTADSALTATTALGVSAGGVGTAALQPGAVDTEALADGAVTSNKIAGALSPSQIPSLDAAKIASGTLDAARIPGLDASQTITGVFDGARIPDLDASKISSGTLADARLSENVALLNASNSFTGSNHLAGVTVADNPNNAFGGTFSGHLIGDVTGDLAGNASTATTADSFTGALIGDVTGTQGATVVSSVGGESAASVAGGVSAANAASSVNIPNTIVKRDGSGAIAVGAIAAISFAGDGSGLTSLDGANISAGTVGNAQLAANAVQTENIADGAVGSGQLASGAAAANLLAGGQSPVPSGGMILSTNSADVSLMAAGYVKLGKVFLNDGWEQRSTNGAPSPRAYHSAIWTGSEMIVWGGYNDDTYFNDGARYNPATDTWTPISTTGAPSQRHSAAAHWTGSRMIVWGGVYGNPASATNDGAVYDPALDSWTPMSSAGAPAPRAFGTAANAWTGSEFIVWGGHNGINVLGNGGRYHLATDTWTDITSLGAPSARSDMIFAWSGTELLIYGGFTSTTVSGGHRYNPTSDSWSTMSTTGNPGTRRTADDIGAWTGGEMIFWGGMSGNSGSEANSGGRYNPNSNTWSSMRTQDAPVSRFFGYAVIAGGEYIYWGGERSTPSTFYRDGGRYDLDSDAWTPMTLDGAPPARSRHTMIWTGKELLIFGGADASTTFGDLWAYTPPQEFYLYQRP